ncbi:MAG: M48 family metallopeptidase [Oscillospiraceae bacterium]|nr:M48 family metallopeptidase [Oscillospiraceae bacterium]
MLKTIMIDGERVEYTLERKRVKNINLRIKPDGSIFVSAARGVPMAAIERMMLENAPYIVAHREKAAARMERLRDCADGRAVRLFGAVCLVEVRTGAKNAVEYSAGRVVISLRDVQDDELRQKTLDKWLRAQCVAAVTACCERVYPAFAARGVKWPEIRFRRMTSRWGSCQPTRGVLTFNTGLVHADAQCIEYVVAHEFCHFLHPDHSPAFHAELAALIPDWRERKKRLNDTPLPSL